MTDVSHLLSPPRSRYGIDWSVKVRPEGVSPDRFVLYGLERQEILDFLAARGAARGEQLLEATRLEVGDPFRVMVGADGDRTKLYGDLDGSDPAMVCVDLFPDGRHTIRTYRRGGPAELEAALAECEPRAAAELRWLAGQAHFERDGLYHFAFQRSTPTGLYTGGDLGFASNWEALAARDPRMYRLDLVAAMLERHGYSEHLDTVAERLARPPLGTIDYVGFRLLPGGRFAVNIYAKKNPVQPGPGGLCEVDKVGQLFRYRPLIVRFALAERPGLAFRLRPRSEREAYRTLGQWQLDYSAQEGWDSQELVTSGALDRAELAARGAAAAGTPHDPSTVLAALRALDGVASAWLEPDPTGDTLETGIDQHYD